MTKNNGIRDLLKFYFLLEIKICLLNCFKTGLKSMLPIISTEIVKFWCEGTTNDLKVF